MQRIKPHHLLAIAVAAIFVVFLLSQALADRPGARVEEDGVVIGTIAAVDTNASSTFQIRLLEGSDAEHESTHVFEALAGLPGVGAAALDTESLELAVEYDDAAIGQADIRRRLVDAGYIPLTRDDATPAELAEDGSVQRLSVADTGTGFDPALILLDAGVPAELTFSAGQECRVAVAFPELGIEQDISQGGTVALPALEPGQYQILCSGGAREGTLIVE